MKYALPAIIAVAAVALMSPAGAQDKPEMPKVRLAVGGKSAIFYLPLSVTERLGYLKDAGLEVEIADVQSGARALQSLVGGSADVGVGTSLQHSLDQVRVAVERRIHQRGRSAWTAAVQDGRFALELFEDCRPIRQPDQLGESRGGPVLFGEIGFIGQGVRPFSA